MTTPAAEFRAGVLAILPAAVAVIPFGLVLGAMAGQKGLSAAEVTLFSGLVFAGSSQFLAVELWSEPAPWLALGAAVLLINLRHILMGASIAAKLQRFPVLWRAVAVFFLTDESWAIAEARAARQELTPAYYAGLSAMLYANWVLWTVLGTQLGALIADPKAFGFDLAFTAIFIALIGGFWKGRPTLAVIATSALVAVAVHATVPGPWYVLAGALSGVAVAGALATMAAREQDA